MATQDARVGADGAFSASFGTSALAVPVEIEGQNRQEKRAYDFVVSPCQNWNSGGPLLYPSHDPSSFFGAFPASRLMSELRTGTRRKMPTVLGRTDASARHVLRLENHSLPRLDASHAEILDRSTLRA